MKITLAVHSLQRPSVRKRKGKKKKKATCDIRFPPKPHFANVTHLDRFISCAGDKEILKNHTNEEKKKKVYKCAKSRKF